MSNIIMGRVSQNGRVVIPAAIRKALGLTAGTVLAFEVKDHEIRIKKLPTQMDWANLIKELPVENVEVDEQGHYDPKKSPSFHDWMVNG